MNILVLTPYAPWPAYGGGTMRIFQLVRGVAQRHTVTCLTFMESSAALADIQQHLAPATVHGVVGPARRSLWRRAWQMATSLLPDMALRNQDANYEQALQALLTATRYDVVVAFSIEMAPYLRIVQRAGMPCVFDEFNAEYVIQKRAALTDARNPRRWHAAAYSLVQWFKLAAFEADAVARADALTVVSHDDGRILQALAPTAQPVVIPNGVDTDYFDGKHVIPHGFTHPTLVFSGTLDYRPNVDAVCWFVAEVLPLLRQRIPDIVLVAVGRRPAPVLQALHAAGELVLTGEVADTRPYLCGAQAYVVPMRIGGGVRLKVLEAMSLALPIVSTSLGVEGIDHLQPAYCRIADTPQAMTQAICDVVAHPQTVPAARTFVQTDYDWRVIVPRFVAVLDTVVAQHVTRG